MSVLGPTTEILSFAWPKESIQRKSHPTFRLNPPLLAFAEGFRKGLPAPPKTSGILAAPLRAILAKSSDARGGITGPKPSQVLKEISENVGWATLFCPPLAVYV
jgi:hypothetical protein